MANRIEGLENTDSESDPAMSTVEDDYKKFVLTKPFEKPADIIIKSLELLKKFAGTPEDPQGLMYDTALLQTQGYSVSDVVNILNSMPVSKADFETVFITNTKRKITDDDVEQVLQHIKDMTDKMHR